MPVRYEDPITITADDVAVQLVKNVDDKFCILIDGYDTEPILAAVLDGLVLTITTKNFEVDATLYEDHIPALIYYLGDVLKVIQKPAGPQKGKTRKVQIK